MRSSPIPARIGVWCIVGLLWAAPGARAATVEVTVIPGSARDMIASTFRVDVTAAASERNAIGVVREPAGTVLVQDTAAPLRLGGGCVVVTASTARCSARTAIGTVRVQIGNRGGRVAVDPALGASVTGGAGADTLSASGTLRGGGGSDTLTGGPLADSLVGGAGSDTLRGGGGDDALVGDGGGAGASDDVLDGGDGEDTVSYKARRRAVLVDVGAGAAGQRNEGDRLLSIENVSGGRGADLLRGDGRPNRIKGGAGRDRIDGRGGADVLDGDRGVDVVRGGAGDDTVSAGDAGDRVFGGPGGDRLTVFVRGTRMDGGAGADAFALFSAPGALACGAGQDTLSPHARGVFDALVLHGCERISMGAGLVTVSVAPRRAGDGSLTFSVSCRPQGQTPTTACRGRIRVAGHAPATFDLPVGTTRRVRLVARGVRRRPLLDVRVTGQGVNQPPFVGVQFAVEWRVRPR